MGKAANSRWTLSLRMVSMSDTIAEYLSAWLQEQLLKVAHSTYVLREGTNRNYILPAIGGVVLQRLGSHQITDLLLKLKRGEKETRHFA